MKIASNLRVLELNRWTLCNGWHITYGWKGLYISFAETQVLVCNYTGHIKARSSVIWPKISTDITTLVSICDICPNIDTRRTRNPFSLTLYLFKVSKQAVTWQRNSERRLLRYIIILVWYIIMLLFTSSWYINSHFILYFFFRFLFCCCCLFR